MKLFLGLIGGALLALAPLGWSADSAPDCPAYGRSLSINNAQVLHWKRTTANQFRERAHVEGTVVRIFDDRNGHDHFEIQIGKRDDETLEVIYNQDFGSVPTPAIGMQVEACGDYITSTAQSGPYPPSPSGAIIHWVHMNPKGRGHEPGFLMIDGILYGQNADQAGPKPTAPGQNQGQGQQQGRHGRHHGHRHGVTSDAEVLDEASGF